MKKWNEIKQEPITWGSYTKFCGIYMAIVFGVYAAIWIGAAAVCYYHEITNWMTKTVNKMKTKFKK
jgi:hypothetical protein